MADVVIERALRPTEEVRILVEELEAELASHYPAEQRHGLKLDAIFQPNIHFFVGRKDGSADACGGVAIFDDFAELKRMYVRPSARGAGLADAIIARLEAEARSSGRSIVRIETGTEQAAAIRFYERHGYAVCGAFEPYASMPPHQIAGSVFMEKRLSSRAERSVVEGR